MKLVTKHLCAPGAAMQQFPIDSDHHKPTCVTISPSQDHQLTFGMRKVLSLFYNCIFSIECKLSNFIGDLDRFQLWKPSSEDVNRIIKFKYKIDFHMTPKYLKLKWFNLKNYFKWFNFVLWTILLKLNDLKLETKSQFTIQN